MRADQAPSTHSEAVKLLLEEELFNLHKAFIQQALPRILRMEPDFQAFWQDLLVTPFECAKEHHLVWSRDAAQKILKKLVDE